MGEEFFLVEFGLFFGEGAETGDVEAVFFGGGRREVSGGERWKGVGRKDGGGGGGRA